MVHGDVGPEVAVHAAIAVVVGNIGQSVHHCIIVDVAKVKKFLGSIATIANRHSEQQVLDCSIDITLTCVNVGTVDIDLRLDTEQGNGLVHLFYGGLVVAARYLNLCQAVHRVIVHRLGAQNGLKGLLGSIEVAKFEVGLGNQVGTCQGLGL